VHDVCAVAWVAEPDLFGLVPARVQVEVTGQFTAGMTVTDFGFPGEVGSENAQVAMRIDADKFWDVTLGTYARVADAIGR
jgi:purine nucleosidase